MKVLLISRALVAASQDCQLREMAKGGIDLTVLAPDRWESQMFESRPTDGYELMVAPTRAAWPILGRLAHHTFYFSGASRVVRRESWDLVHIDDEPYNFATYRVVSACKDSGVKFAFSTYQNFMKDYPPPFSFFERTAFKNSVGAIARNEEALAILRRRGFRAAATVIPPGFDLSLFRKLDATDVRQNLDVQHRFVIGYIGRIVYEKGLDILIRSLASLPTESVLLFIGSGPHRPILNKLAFELGLSSRVLWIPWVKSSELPQYMNALDALVLPSRTTANWKEQFGRVLAEAMACETCVVGSDSGEIPNVIGDVGLIFHEEDSEQLAACLRRLMDDLALRHMLGGRGRERVLKRFGSSNLAQSTISFYKRLCGLED